MSGAAYAIGIDVGGTKIAGGVVELATGQVRLRQMVPTQPERGGQAVLEDAVQMAAGLAQTAAQQQMAVDGVGVGVCELVGPQGQITSAHNFDWRELPVAQAFHRVAPATIESDVRAPALAEARYGAGRTFRLFAYITVGTGISSTLVQAGQPFAGAHGNALVLATMPLTTRCTACGTLLNPVMEEIASGPALVAEYNRRSGNRLRRAEEVLAASQSGDLLATEVVTYAGESLGNSVGFLVNVLDPEAVVVGGGLGMAGGLYWESFVSATRAHIYADDTRQLPILPAALGVDAGLIGAAAATKGAAWQE
jgi:glucokinase